MQGEVSPVHPQRCGPGCCSPLTLLPLMGGGKGLCPHVQPPADFCGGPLVPCVLSKCPSPTRDPRPRWGHCPGPRDRWLPSCLDAEVPPPPAVSSGSVTVNADSSVQLLAEEAVTLDMLDLGVSV